MIKAKTTSLASDGKMPYPKLMINIVKGTAGDFGLIILATGENQFGSVSGTVLRTGEHYKTHPVGHVSNAFSGDQLVDYVGELVLENTR